MAIDDETRSIASTIPVREINTPFNGRTRRAWPNTDEADEVWFRVAPKIVQSAELQCCMIRRYLGRQCMLVMLREAVSKSMRLP